MKFKSVLVVAFTLASTAFAGPARVAPQPEQLLAAEGFRKTWHCEDGDGDQWAYFDVMMKPGGEIRILSYAVDSDASGENGDERRTLLGVDTPRRGNVGTGEPLVLTSPNLTVRLAARFMGASGNVGYHAAIVNSTYPQLTHRELGEYNMDCYQEERR